MSSPSITCPNCGSSNTEPRDTPPMFTCKSCGKDFSNEAIDSIRNWESTICPKCGKDHGDQTNFLHKNKRIDKCPGVANLLGANGSAIDSLQGPEITDIIPVNASLSSKVLEFYEDPDTIGDFKKVTVSVDVGNWSVDKFVHQLIVNKLVNYQIKEYFYGGIILVLHDEQTLQGIRDLIKKFKLGKLTILEFYEDPISKSKTSSYSFVVTGKSYNEVFKKIHATIYNTIGKSFDQVKSISAASSKSALVTTYLESDAVEIQQFLTHLLGGSHVGKVMMDKLSEFYENPDGFKVGDKVQCISGDYRGYLGIIKSINHGIYTVKAQVTNWGDFTASGEELQLLHKQSLNKSESLLNLLEMGAYAASDLHPDMHIGD